MSLPNCLLTTLRFRRRARRRRVVSHKSGRSRPLRRPDNDLERARVLARFPVKESFARAFLRTRVAQARKRQPLGERTHPFKPHGRVQLWRNSKTTALKYVDVVNCVRLEHDTVKVFGLCVRPFRHTELFLQVRLSPNRAFLVPLNGRRLAHSDNRDHREHLVDAKKKRPPLAARGHVFHLPVEAFEAVVGCLISTVPAVAVRPVPVTTPQTKLGVIPVADENAAVDALTHVPQEKVEA